MSLEFISYVNGNLKNKFSKLCYDLRLLTTDCSIEKVITQFSNQVSSMKSFMQSTNNYGFIEIFIC